MCVFQRSQQELNSEAADPKNMSKAKSNAGPSGLAPQSDKSGPITMDKLKFDVKISDLKDLMQLKGKFNKIKILYKYKI